VAVCEETPDADDPSSAPEAIPADDPDGSA
jgi:hypothetical protein